jgi:hypothetical protein
MGTRADFYIGQGQDAEWLGSVGFDGCDWVNDPTSDLMLAKSPDEFRAAVVIIQAERRDFTAPEDGWPWPWENSKTTDYAYVFYEGKTNVYSFGHEITLNDDQEIKDESPKVDWFPDMKSRQNIQYGVKSGLIIVSA